MQIDPRAGTLPLPSDLINLDQLIAAYYDIKPNCAIAEQRVVFGTSGHRGSSLNASFNENHILAIAQAICLYRSANGISGPLFLGIDTHALSTVAMKTAIEVLAANGVTVMVAENNEWTPTPVISHAILSYNKKNKSALADGIIITPSHNPPHDGGFKYNPPTGGPAPSFVTDWIQEKANAILSALQFKRIPYRLALQSSIVKNYNYMDPYIEDLSNVIDMEAIKASGLLLGVDPLGGAGVHYWEKIAERYMINLKVLNLSTDPQFPFIPLDWDGQIRMDPSSPYAMQTLIQLQNKFDIAFACDTDHDRHGIVTKTEGLISSNHFLSVMMQYLFTHRPKWTSTCGIGKTVVSTMMIDKIAKWLKRPFFETPVGFKWFTDGLLNGSLGCVGEESAGATFLKIDGSPFSTDKDGIICCLLGAEMTARLGKDPSQLYNDLIQQFGPHFSQRIEAAANIKQKTYLKNITPETFPLKTLVNAPITSVFTHMQKTNIPIGGVKVISEKGWFAIRPSGTENLIKIYAESFESDTHLRSIIAEAQLLLN